MFTISLQLACAIKMNESLNASKPEQVLDAPLPSIEKLHRQVRNGTASGRHLSRRPYRLLADSPERLRAPLILVTTVSSAVVSTLTLYACCETVVGLVRRCGYLGTLKQGG